ncbi:SMI1/KNR4 family protein [Flavobacterium sp. ALJ2]|uniref:SMI1/KNR4 family protein n=1 Tax=Flavobacterium sp. ALJ2 TaxID=2786960 RepID=UPI00189D1F1C|nr:SMI1/KNR4 family protein [Flavobacterium sp. ALJ2]MBF7092633.1 SMI1/KNR4 family protein [Flavobacterium sp. ALJ2]
MSFEKEINFLLQNENKDFAINEKIRATNQEILELKNEYPNIPNDFLEYLLEIGSGNIMESQFKVMNKLFDFNDLGLEDIYDLPDNIKLFGDNFSGDFSGFNIDNNIDEVIEFWHDSNEIYYTGKTFREYIREKMLMR